MKLEWSDYHHMYNINIVYTLENQNDWSWKFTRKIGDFIETHISKDLIDFTDIVNECHPMWQIIMTALQKSAC